MNDSPPDTTVYGPELQVCDDIMEMSEHAREVYDKILQTYADRIAGKERPLPSDHAQGTAMDIMRQARLPGPGRSIRRQNRTKKQAPKVEHHGRITLR